MRNKKIAATILLTFIFTFFTTTSFVFAQTEYDWVRLRNNKIPADAVLAGYETDKNKTYICRVTYRGQTIPGKVLDARCYYNWNERTERDTSRFEILVGKGFLWQRHTSNYSRAVIGGSNGDENFYICRVTTTDGQYPGRLEDGRCYYSANNRGYSSRRFEMLQGSERTNTLINAASYGSLQKVKDALRDGQAINQTDSNGQTALMIASGKGYQTVVRELIYERATIDLRDKKGNTALMFAAEKGA